MWYVVYMSSRAKCILTLSLTCDMLCICLQELNVY
jgi:hypothetical protein